MAKGNSIAASMIYKTLERFSVMAFQMIVQIVIARILSPADYGIVAMMAVFIHIASIFINTGFNSAVIQKKDAGKGDYSTALLINLLIGITLYLLLFFSAPAISSFYHQPKLIVTLRVLGLILPLGSISSIQSAIATREMLFRKLFICNVFGSVVSGVAGIVAAVCGLGCWALIIQQLSHVLVITLALTVKASWEPSLAFDRKSAKEMFSFGWKMLAAGLINAIYNELNSLIIGRKYSSSDLAFYTKGKTFPSTLTFGVDSALQSVTLSVFSKKQTDRNNLHQLLHKTLVSNSSILMPSLLLLGIVAEPLTLVLLTEKWLPLVPYMQICCFTFAFHPMASIDMQVIAAVGRSDMRLRLEFIKKPIGLLLLILAIPYGPMAIAISAAVTSIVSLIVGIVACAKIVGYSFGAHIRDVLPIIIVSIVSVTPVFFLHYLITNNYVLLFAQCFIAITLYLLLSHVFKMEGINYFKPQVIKIWDSLRRKSKVDNGADNQ